MLAFNVSKTITGIKKTLYKFVDWLQRTVGDKILAVYHFGSTSKGMGKADSDIDVLTAFTGIGEKEPREKILGNLLFYEV